MKIKGILENTCIHCNNKTQNTKFCSLRCYWKFKKGKILGGNFKNGYDIRRVDTQFKKGFDSKRGELFTDKIGNKYIVNTGKTRFKTGVPLSEQIGEKAEMIRQRRVRKTMKKKWEDKDWAEKRVKQLLLAQSHKKSNLEISMSRILDKTFSEEWKYVGDFSCFIGGKCPDFINVNGQKKLIEVFGNFWHDKADEQKRIKHFAKYGFKTLV